MFERRDYRMQFMRNFVIDILTDDKLELFAEISHEMSLPFFYMS